jgi:hypothetical protein
MHEIKYIDVTFSDRTTWRLSAREVAEVRARYYAEGDAARGDGDYDAVFAAEVESGLTDRVGLLDYLQNNMNWEDFADTALLLAAPDYRADYQREFASASKTIEWNNENKL